jgi:4-aminobutyrate aminotransferase-like enzyme
MTTHCNATGRRNGACETRSAEVGDACRENGLFVSAEEDVLMLFPALNISRATAQRGLDLFEKSL